MIILAVIIDMDMPSSCTKCNFHILNRWEFSYGCKLRNGSKSSWIEDGSRIIDKHDCPLKELKATEVIKMLGDYIEAYKEAMERGDAKEMERIEKELASLGMDYETLMVVVTED
jgi:hypothetical protein